MKRIQKSLLILAICVIALFAVTACDQPKQEQKAAKNDAKKKAADDSAQKPKKEEPMKIVVTTSILADFAKQLLGDPSRVYTIVKPKDDPKTYTPTQADLNACKEAGVIFAIGRGYEKPLIDLLAKTYDEKLVRLAKGATIKFIQDTNGQIIPEMWWDIDNAKAMIATMAEEMAKRSPIEATNFKILSKRFQRHLDQLGKDAKQAFASLPLDNVALIAPDPSLAYIGRNFNLKANYIKNLNEMEKELDRLSQYAQKIKPSVFFYSKHAKPDINKAMDKLANQAKTKGYAPKVGGSLYAFTLDDDDGEAQNYIAAYEANIRQIVQAFGDKEKLPKRFQK